MTSDIGDISKVRRDIAEIRRKRRAARREFYLRGVGYVTRTLVYFGPLSLLAWWSWPYAVALSHSPTNLTITDYLLVGGCVFGAVIPLMLFFFNVDGDPIEWENWGKVGLGLAPLAAAGLWLAYG